MPTLQSLIALFGIGALSLHFLQNRQTLVSQPSGDTLILTLANPIDPILEQFESKIFSSREEKATAIKEALTTATSEWHAPVHALLKPLGVETTSFWATNKVLVRGSTPLIENVIRTFDSSIEIWKNAVIPLLPTFDLIEGTPPDGPEWNINNIGAPEVWDGGFLGQGVLVASIDTGVHWTHEALIGGFNEENGWFDPIFGFPFPVDTNGYDLIIDEFCQLRTYKQQNPCLRMTIFALLVIVEYRRYIKTAIYQRNICRTKIVQYNL